MATGAEVIGTAVYHALGYNVVETYLVDVHPSRLAIAPDATVTEGGRTRPFTRRDLDALLRRAARKADGSYRATASPFAEGRDLGPFRYYGTRPDDPNDIYPHEHRRELRGNRVFAAWLNHDDSRGGNSLDMLVGPTGRQHVKHYMFDFGSILGSGTSDPDHPWAGHEYVFEGRRALRTMATFGLWRRPFMAVKAPERLPAAGSFTADGFAPEGWKPHFPNAAFVNMQPDDAFWAARIVAAFPPEGIRRIVEKARYSDPAVVDHVTGALLRRRGRVIQAWLATRNPIVDVRLDADGTLRFRNAVVDAGIADAPEGHELAWFRFDNVAGTRRYAAGVATEGDAAATAPAAFLAGAAYAGVDITTVHPQYPQWRTPVRVYFRRVPGGWQTVGIDRQVGPEGALYAQR
jgi:hypothetical protein